MVIPYTGAISMEHIFPIVIIGAGPVGMVTALFLSKYQIPSIIIERRPGISQHPKSRGINVRTMELMRLLSIENALRQYELPKEARRFTWCTQLGGDIIQDVTSHPTQHDHSPTCAALISQDKVERELLRACEKDPLIDIRFNQTCVDIAKQNEKNVVFVKNTEQQQEALSCRFLIAADGANSSLRELLDINMVGKDNLGEYCNIYCRINLSEALKNHISAGYFFTEPSLVGRFFLSVNGRDEWLFGMKVLTEQGQTKADFTKDFCMQMVRECFSKDLTIDKIDIISTGFWTMAATIAENYQYNNMFLVGDAAHRLPPTGGLGMNTGIQDAHNLAWKIAYVLKGFAKKDILDSYTRERIPVAEQNIHWSMKNAERFIRLYEAIYSGNLQQFQHEVEQQTSHINSHNLDLGFQYQTGIVHDVKPTIDPNDNSANYQQQPYTGCRAPHFEVNYQNKTYSILDILQSHFVLLTAEKENKWQAAIKNIKTAFPLSIYQILPEGIPNSENILTSTVNFLALYQIEQNGAVLTRPDGHIAWRCITAPSNREEKLVDVFNQLRLMVSL